MKRILITGTNSYIGNSLETWLLKEPNTYQVDKISLRDDKWKGLDFRPYDSLVHVAGIVHKKETRSNIKSYYKVNRDLTNEIAQKAKKEKVKQFVFISSMSVYGKDSGIIDDSTPLKPKNAYGKSKLEAEILLKVLENDSFKIAIIRPPMVYGGGAKGNYSKLSKLAKITPVFPNIENKRSMIYIDNLAELIKLLIDYNSEGYFSPQNEEYVNTSTLVLTIGEMSNHKILQTKVFNPVIHCLRRTGVFNKIFGTLHYSKSLSRHDKNYQIVDFRSSIAATESYEG